jgi:hypothetical protein
MNISNFSSHDFKLIPGWDMQYPVSSGSLNWTTIQKSGHVDYQGSYTSLITTGSGNIGDAQIGSVGIQSTFDLPTGNFEIEVVSSPAASMSIHWNIPEVTTLNANGLPVYTAGRCVDLQAVQLMLYETVSGSRQPKFVGSNVPEGNEVTSVRIQEMDGRTTVTVNGSVYASIKNKTESVGGKRLIISNGSINYFGFMSYAHVGQELNIYDVRVRKI